MDSRERLALFRAIQEAIQAYGADVPHELLSQIIDEGLRDTMAAERERCARVAERVGEALALCDPPGGSGGALTVAAAIRGDAK